MRSTSTSPSWAFRSQSSGGRSACMPAATSTSSARSASSWRTIRSRSCSVSGPPRAQQASPPPRRNGTPASRNAAAPFFMVARMSSNSSRTRSRGTLQARLVKRAAPIRVAAAGDIHASPERRTELERAFAALAGRADLLLLAGDLTTYGEPEQAEVLAAVCDSLDMPVLAVLGNHDWHSGRQDEIAAVLEAGGITMLDRSWTVVDLDGTNVGVVGTKGFVGGFPD